MKVVVGRVIWCVALGFVLFAVMPLVHTQTCSSCEPAPKSGVSVGGSRSVCISTGFSATERDNMKIGIETYWPGVLANTGSPVTLNVVIAANQSAPTCTTTGADIMITADSAAAPDLAIAAHTSNGVGATIKVNPTYLGDYYGTGTSGQNLWQNVGAHEIGHIVGFENVSTTGCASATIMKVPVTYDALMSNACSDAAAALLKYPKRDDDGDGFSPDDPSETDCDDTRNDIYPGASISCEYAGEDRNCNGETDFGELVCPLPGENGSPIVIDVVGNGFALTNRQNGVNFDLNADSVAGALPWTSAGSDDAWLVLDRNGNGLVDNGSELFGNFTPQPQSAAPNGFIALAVYDAAAAGGNADGWIDRNDSVFSALRLWVDSNHDGLSQPTELKSMAALGLERISLDYRESQHRDQWGNRFQYRAKVIGSKARDGGPWAYDVFLGQGKRTR